MYSTYRINASAGVWEMRSLASTWTFASLNIINLPLYSSVNVHAHPGVHLALGTFFSLLRVSALYRTNKKLPMAFFNGRDVGALAGPLL